MPWLDLLAEDDLHLVGVLGLDGGNDGCVDGIEQFFGELGLSVIIDINSIAPRDSLLGKHSPGTARGC